MISVLIFYKILQLFTIMLLGFLLVKLKIIKSGDSLGLSKISLYLLIPAALLNSFQITLTAEIAQGLLLAFAAAIAIHLVLLIIDFLYKKITNASGVERASIVYSNAAGFIIPIISFSLGEEWIIYSSAFVSVQIIFLWIHGISLFSTDGKPRLKKVLLNVNILAIAVGVCLLLSGIRLPALLAEISSTLGGMLGNVSMLIAGMLMAEVDFKKILTNKKVYLVSLMRMVVCPAVVLLVLKLVQRFIPIDNSAPILLISFLATITPSAATVMQFSQIYGKDTDFAASVNVLTTISCIITMPVFVMLF